MVDYTVEVYSSTVITLENVYIRLIGTNGESEPQMLHTALLPILKSKICCPESLGTLLLVELDAKASIVPLLNEWFCAKVVVTTPEGEKVSFPCYQYLDKKKPMVSLRTDTAKLINFETDSILLTQRQLELKQRQQDFKWKEYHPAIPCVIDATSASDLPNEVRFSFTKEIEMGYNAVAVFSELELETFIHCSDSWRDLEELRSVIKHPKPKEHVLENWKIDEFFGYQYLNGLNPMMIEHCSELPKNFPVTEEMVRMSLGGESLKKEMQNGNIFLCDYKRLSEIKGNVIDKRQQYVAAPLVLLFCTPEKRLIPVAIQLYQEPSEDNPIFLCTDSEWDWLLAKIFVRNAEFNEHELNYHLLRTHLLAEVFSLATMRNLPSAHPLFKLLLPHTRYTFQINIMARNLLLSDTGFLEKYTGIGRCEGVDIFLPRAMSSLTYSDLCLPENIKKRGLENIPRYYYRDFGLKLWEVIHKFVEGVVTFYYQNDDTVKNDSELQQWIHEIFQFGFLENDKSGIPQSFNKVEEVIKFITMVIFTVSGQHAAINNSQFDFGGWMPNLPSALRLSPPKKKGEATEKTILETLPDVTTTVHGLAVLYLPSKKSHDHYPLGEYKEELFGEDEPCRLISEFKDALHQMDKEVDALNFNLDFPYIYLKPENVDNSVAL